MIAHRRGFGDMLAEGLLRAGDVLGEEVTRHFANEVAGVGDGATYSAREYPMNGLLYAFEPRQPIAMLHEVSRLVGFWVMHQGNPRSSPVDNTVFRAAAARFWGHPEAWDLTNYEGKDDVLKAFNYTDPVQSVFMNPEVIVPGPGDSVISKKGATLSPRAFETMRNEFYALRRWDVDSGCQQRPTLEDQGLSGIAKEIDGLGLIRE